MLLPAYLHLLEAAERALAESFHRIATGHADEADVFHTCHTLAEQCAQHAATVGLLIARYGQADAAQPDAAQAESRPWPLAATRSGPLGLLRDLHDSFALASFVEMNWTLTQQAANALRDEELLNAAASALKETELQLAWLRTRLKEAAPQALVAAS